MRISIDLSDKEFSMIMKARMTQDVNDEELLRINEELAIECQALKAQLAAKPTKPVYIPVSDRYYSLVDVIDNVEIYSYDQLISGHTYIAWYGDDFDDSVKHPNKQQLAKLINHRKGNK